MKGDIALTEYADFMGNMIHVGDAVVAVRVPDRTPQMYTGEVLAIKDSPVGYGSKMRTKIQVLPTGGYSTEWYKHGKWSKEGVKPVWVQAENVLRYPPEIA